MKHLFLAFALFAFCIATATDGIAQPNQNKAAPEQTTEEDLDEDLDYLDEEEEEIVDIADPLYYWNYGMYHFNDRLYFWALKPVAKGYRYITPSAVRNGVKNMFHNIAVPIRFVNCLLQGKVGEAGQEAALFFFDTTIGFLGFRSMAQQYPDEVKHAEEDFGQTLGAWGLGNGFYVVWPFFGPSTVRDSFGMAGDRFLNPIAYVDPTWASISITAFKTVNNTSLRIGDYESLKQAAIEPYDAIRDAYVQNRKKKVAE